MEIIPIELWEYILFFMQDFRTQTFVRRVNQTFRSLIDYNKEYMCISSAFRKGNVPEKAILYCVKSGYLKSVQYCIGIGAWNILEAFVESVKSNNIPLVKYFLDIEKVTYLEEGFHCALCTGNEEMIKLFVSRGCTIQPCHIPYIKKCKNVLYGFLFDTKNTFKIDTLKTLNQEYIEELYLHFQGEKDTQWIEKLKPHFHVSDSLEIQLKVYIKINQSHEFMLLYRKVTLNSMKVALLRYACKESQYEIVHHILDSMKQVSYESACVAVEYFCSIGSLASLQKYNFVKGFKLERTILCWALLWNHYDLVQFIMSVLQVASLKAHLLVFSIRSMCSVNFEKSLQWCNCSRLKQYELNEIAMICVKENNLAALQTISNKGLTNVSALLRESMERGHFILAEWILHNFYCTEGIVKYNFEKQGSKYILRSLKVVDDNKLC